MFFLADCRYNLETNLGNDGGELEDFIDNLQQNGDKMYISTDSKCAHGTAIYSMAIYISRKHYNPASGRRSGLGLKINRENPESVFNIPLAHITLDPNHMISRIMEKVLKVLVRQIHQISS